jgi:protein-S-isoprenylcysteine O-methyltransferase Ste14
MFLRALGAFLVLPGLAAIIFPPLLAVFDPWSKEIFLPGSFIMLIGASLLMSCVRDFYVAGKGTLAPWDPPKNLVVVGLYRYLRNPMYVGVLTLVAGWTLLFESPLLLLYEIILAVGFHIWVLKYEEPKLESLFGNDWLRYSAAVRRWIPCRKPWNGGS